MVERGWLELAVENLMSKNEALHKQVDALSREVHADQMTARLAEATVQRLEVENGQLVEERNSLQDQVFDRQASPKNIFNGIDQKSTPECPQNDT